MLAASLGPQGGEGAPALAAWVRWELNPPENWPQQLRAALAEELPTAAVPVCWAAVTAFPLTERGGVDRAALPAPQMIASSGAVPQTPTEKTLAALWCEVLGLAKVGPVDDFLRSAAFRRPRCAALTVSPGSPVAGPSGRP
jgi:hypothetical protein